jgi:MFS transporter, ACDE family, multidrug resistance protein
VPFWVGAGAVVLGVLVLLTARREIGAVDEEVGETQGEHERLEAEAVTVGDA